MPLSSESGLPTPSGPPTEPELDFEIEANTSASSFFDIPPVISDENYVDKSNTEVAWTPGYFDLIHFKAWNDFEEKVWAKGMQSFRQIPLDLRQSAKSMMDAARSQILESNQEEKRIALEAAEIASSEDASSGDEGSDESDEISIRETMDQSDSGAFTNCASVKPMMDSVVLAVQSLLRASLSLDPEKKKHYVRCKNELEISTVKLTNSFGDYLRLSTPQIIKADVGVVLGVVRKGKKRKSPNSSASLSATSRFNVGGVLPLCSFEMKGPTLDMTGTTAIAKMERSNQRLSSADGGEVNNGDISHDDEEAQSIADEAVSIAEGNTNTDPGSIPLYTAQQVADAFNFLFSKSRFIDKKRKEGGPIRSSIYRIAQVVTYAILSLGQCSFLYNLQSGIGFHVVSISRRQLTVEVTGVLSTDKAPNCGSAMYAITKYCLDQYFAEGSESLSSKVRAVARKVSNQAYYRDVEPSDPSDSTYSPEEESTDGSNSQNSSGGTADDENTVRDQVLTATQSSVHPELSLKLLRLQDRKGKHVVPFRELSENHNLMKVSTTMDVALKDMLENFDEVVGSGATAVVLRSNFMKSKVAVKIPFDSSFCSKQSVAQEIETYLELHRVQSPLLGDVVPRLVLAWNSPQKSSVYGHMIFLVTEYVGHKLVRNKRGQLCIGDSTSRFEVLSANDELQIRDSAIDGLRKMHRHGILHCDVALRNLRAERVADQSGDTWRTWWVDLGQSTKCTPEVGTILHDMDLVEAFTLI